MAFEAQKSELIHFNKGRKQQLDAISLTLPKGESTSQVKPTESARFLGVQLDQKLSQRAYCKALGKKLKTQDFALLRIAAKTQGPSLAKAQEVYSKCIRSAIAYRASSYHTLTPIRGKPTGSAKTLAKVQNKSLRIVARAYKSTLTKCLETKTQVPLLDLYLNKRSADFEVRLQQPLLQTGSSPRTPKALAAYIITKACNKLFRRFQGRRKSRGQRPRLGLQGPTVVEQAAVIVTKQANQQQKTREKKGKKLTINQVVELAQQDWQQQQRKDQPLKRLANEDLLELLFINKALKRHQGLTKAQSSLLIQARTGDIGLQDYLFKVKVPEIQTSYCGLCEEGGRERETVEHLVVQYTELPIQKTQNNNEIRSYRDL